MAWKKSQQTDWLSLVEISGPFLAVSVLEKIFPQGLEKVSTLVRRRLRSAYEEWLDAIDENDPLLAGLHKEWIRLVIFELLDFEEAVLLVNQDLETPFTYSPPEHTGSFSPDFVVPGSQADAPPRLLISVFDTERDLESVKSGDGWPASVVERMVGLCRSLDTRIGLITNGERWLLVNAPVGSTTGHTSWYARIWFQEPVTLQAFQSLFGVRRWFGPEEESLPALLEKSLEEHEEITDTLGEQVRQAVEVLVQSLDKADQDRNRELLGDVSPEELYEAGLTVMMRLVFILCAEERELLLLGDPVYDQHYAVTTLRAQLAEEADLHGHEILERRHDAWSRLLAVFRAVYGGIEHETLSMPALGGSLFDPDRFPFLEGRAPETRWRETAAHPLPIDNRTVLLLLTALQILEQKNGALLLSYKALDVEQIGHVYEGLLEHTVRRLPKDTIGLAGTKKAKNPNIALAELESASLDGVVELAELIKETTQKGLPAIKNVLKKDVNRATFSKVVTACGGDTELAERVRPYANLLRTDAWGDFIVYTARSFAVTLGTDRRATGTHYTPKSLTELIVERTLEPIVYLGPTENKPREEWRLKSSAELQELKMCDPAMGSGAFLVQVCRYLSECLVEAWGKEDEQGKFVMVDGLTIDAARTSEPMPESLDERLLIARRLVAEKCLYGVDLNPLAVELAKLSIWLITLAKGRPFGFLDHNLRSGDSLLGLHKLEQLTEFSLYPEKKKRTSLFASDIEVTVKEALALRTQLREIPIRDIRDVEKMERLDQKARQKLESIEHIADAMIGEALASGGNQPLLESAMDNLSMLAATYIEGDDDIGKKIVAKTRRSLSIDLPAGKSPRKPFHWVLEFPEVFERGGFDGIVGNPPYLGAPKISGTLGGSYRELVICYIAYNKKGLADLCAYFLLRVTSLSSKRVVCGLVVTSGIAEGDTRVVGLQQILEQGWSIICANSRATWPGRANVTYSSIWICPCEWGGPVLLNDLSVKRISSLLTEEESISGNPYRLITNKNTSYNGVKVYGNGFVITTQEAEILIKKDRRNKTVLYPYITTKDVNSHPNHQASSWAIRFFDWPLDRDSAPIGYSGQVAANFSECLKIVEERVKPERTRLNSRGEFVVRKPMPQLWWIYGEKRPGLYSAISKLSHVLVVGTQATKYVAFVILNKEMVFSHSLTVIADDSFGTFALLNSSLHEVWARQYAGYNLQLLRYSPSDLLETFPFPEKTKDAKVLGEKYQNYRHEVMVDLGAGITDVYNRFHDSEDMLGRIRTFRKLHIEMDQAVAAAYGWNNLDLGHGFHETKQGIRFTISEKARREVLQRLLKLNHERYEEEVKQGLHDKKKHKKRSTRKSKKVKTNQLTLFDR